MSSKKIFANKDVTLYNDYKEMNTGIDSILELSKDSALNVDGSSVSRILIKFSDEDISSVKNLIGTSSFNCYLNIYSADIQGIPKDLTLYCHPIAEDWDMGTGRYLNYPITSDGACWSYKNSSTSSLWYEQGGYPTGITGSYVSGSERGGSWYTSSYSTQSFSFYQEKDLSFDVTNIIQYYLSGSIINNGFLIKNSDSIEFNDNYNYKLTYFSRDTNTIYPPTLEFKWDDSRHVNITSSIIQNQEIFINLSNNKMDYDQNSINRFRLNVRDKFPTRTFSTTSIYTTQKYLPTSSYYSIKDLKTDLVIIPFHDEYTKISSDNLSNYFDIYMDGLEPERFYKIQIKVDYSGSINIYDDNYIFRVKK